MPFLLEPCEALSYTRFHMTRRTRRNMLALTGHAIVAGSFFPYLSFSQDLIAEQENTPEKRKSKKGIVVGEVQAAKVGEKVLADGGNAIDAIVAAGLVACVTSPAKCGMGGYGGTITIALRKEKKVISIDFNATAPAASKPDMFKVDEKNNVIGKTNFHGWLAVGVPGIPAGFELALTKYGTRSFREMVQPAIAFAEQGCVIQPNMSVLQSRILKTEAAKRGDKTRNPSLAKMLSTLASRNSVDSFYRGDIARQIAEASARGGGLLTYSDLSAYQAREVQPLKISWRGSDVYTAPLTAGGITVLEALNILKALSWEKLSGTASAHARLEALRLAWKDKVDLLGDTAMAKVPVDQMLSDEYAHAFAKKVRNAVDERKPLPLQIDLSLGNGTVNLSSVDSQGNMAAMTITHGNTFGAQVGVENLGLMLGHGMWRFDPRPGHPNSVAPGKRPVHNMCPTVVVRNGVPALAVGGAGGVRIPNAIFDVLVNFVGKKKTMEESVAAPRMNTNGTTDLSLESRWPADETAYFRRIGFHVSQRPGAFAGAVAFDSTSGGCSGMAR